MAYTGWTKIKQPVNSSPTPEKSSLLLIYQDHEDPTTRYTLNYLNFEEEEDEKRKPIKLLEMSSEKYPQGMGFILMENLNTLYMIGGQFENATVDSSSKVYTVDLRLLRVYISSLSSSSEGYRPGPYPPLYSDHRVILSSMISPVVVDAPTMHAGKTNPIVVEAYGKIYVLATPYEYTSVMSLVVQEEEVEQTIFELFDPELQTWIVLSNPSKTHYNLSSSPCSSVTTRIIGHAVVNQLILFHTDDRMFIAYDVEDNMWVYVDCDSPFPMSRFFDPFLMSTLMNLGFVGKGVVADGNILFTLDGSANQIVAHEAIFNHNYSFLGLVRGIDFSSTSSGVGNLVYMGHDKFCHLVNRNNPHEVHITIFRVKKDSCRCRTSLYHASVMESYALQGFDAKQGSVLYCSALHDKIAKDDGRLSRWRENVWRKGNIVAASVCIAGLPVIISACCRFVALLKKS